MFKIPVWVLKKIDQIRKRFLWAGPDMTKRKYYLVKWAIICRPKKNGFGVF
jgi:hypothetical protein